MHSLWDCDISERKSCFTDVAKAKNGHLGIFLQILGVSGDIIQIRGPTSKVLHIAG